MYIDDILVTGATPEEHLKNLEKVLSRLERAGARLKLSNCQFMLKEVEYLGHQISEKALQPTEEKTQALKVAPKPEHNWVVEPNSSLTCQPSWPRCSTFSRRRSLGTGTQNSRTLFSMPRKLSSHTLVAHYDPKQELVLTCDASPYGVRAVLSHETAEGQDRPIAYASRSLTPAERKYAQIDKEALAIVFGVKRFNQYLLGHRFSILADHRPLEHLFKHNRVTSSLASARMQRWALLLGAYNYVTVYKPGAQHANADALSRLSLAGAPQAVSVPAEPILTMEMLQSLLVTAKQIRTWTDRDPVLSQVRSMTLKGWKDLALCPYLKRNLELSVHDDCLL